MCRHELSRGSAAHAEALLDELEATGADAPQLRSELAALRERLAAEQADLAELESLRHDTDVRVGQRARAALATLLGVVFTAGPIYLGVLAERGQSPGWTFALVLPFVAGSTYAAIAWTMREQLLANKVNRQLVWGLLAMFAGIFAHRVMAWGHGIPVSDAVMGDMAVVLATVGAMGITVDRRLLRAAAVMFAGCLAIGLFPTHGHVLMGVTNGLAILAVVHAWK